MTKHVIFVGCICFVIGTYFGFLIAAILSAGKEADREAGINE